MACHYCVKCDQIMERMTDLFEEKDTMTNQEYIKKCDIFMKVHNACKEKCQCNKIDIEEEKEHVRELWDTLLEHEQSGRFEDWGFEKFYQHHVKAFDIKGRKKFIAEGTEIIITENGYYFQ